MRKDITIKYFTPSERKAFFKQLESQRLEAETEQSIRCGIRNEAMFHVLYYCALRVSEVTEILVEDFNPMQNEIYCRRCKGGINNTLRIMDKETLVSLKRHIRFNKPEHFLFENMREHKQLSRKTLDGIIRRTCMDIKSHKPNEVKWHCHTLRHTKAIELAEKGFDLKELQYWLGHSDVSNTQIYFQFTSKQQESMYKKLK